MQDIHYCYDVWINVLINGRSDYKAKDPFAGLQASSELWHCPPHSTCSCPLMFNWQRRDFLLGLKTRGMLIFVLIVSTIGQIFSLTHTILFTKFYNKTFPWVLSKITSICLQFNYLPLNATWPKPQVLKSSWQSSVCASNFLIIYEFNFLLSVR